MKNDDQELVMAPKKKPVAASQPEDEPAPVPTKPARTRKKAVKEFNTIEPDLVAVPVAEEVPSVFAAEDVVSPVDGAEPDLPLPPPTFHELYRKGAQQYQTDHCEEAWVTLTEAAQYAGTVSEKVELCNLQAAILFRRGKGDEALAKAREAVALDDKHMLARQNEITLRLALGKESLEQLQTAIEQLIHQSMDPAALFLAQELALRYFSRRDVRGLRRGRGILQNLPVLWKRLLDVAPDPVEQASLRARCNERFVPILSAPIATMPSKDMEIYHQRVDLLMGGNEVRGELIKQAWTLVTQQLDDPIVWRGWIRAVVERFGPSQSWERPFWEAWFLRVPKPKAMPEVYQATRAFLSWVGAYPAEAFVSQAPHLQEQWKDPLWDHQEPARPLRIGWVWQAPAKSASMRFWQRLMQSWTKNRPTVHTVYKVGPIQVDAEMASVVEVASPGDAVARIAEDRLDVCILCDWNESKWFSPLGWARHAPVQLAWGSQHSNAACTVDGWMNLHPECPRAFPSESLPTPEMRRSDLGLPTGVHILSVPHRPSKLNVRFLSLLKEILTRDPMAVAVLLESTSVVEQEEMVDRVSELFGPYLATRIRWIPPSNSPAMYLATLQHSTLVLLPPSVESPQVVYDAAYGRTCVMAMAETSEVAHLLRLVPAGETLIARTDGAYVQQAVRLLQEPNLRDNAVATVAALTQAPTPYAAWEREIWRWAGARDLS